MIERHAVAPEWRDVVRLWYPGPAMTVYDRAKWHYNGTFPRGTPASQGFVHMGMFLTWIILRGYAEESFFRNWLGKDMLTPIRARTATACSLRDWLDETLASDMMTEDGRAFSDCYYDGKPGYIEDWVEEFGDAGECYAVPDGWETFERIATVIDERYAEWVAAGRPKTTQPP